MLLIIKFPQNIIVFNLIVVFLFTNKDFSP
jgi:hypothetical protein